MKKTNLIKIFAPVVAIALLIGALVGISASAAETTPAIVSKNVEYGSELYLYYAVDKATVEGTPKLEVVTADGTQVLKTVTAYDEENVNGTDCYIFKTAGIAPGQLNKVEYVRAVGTNGASDIVSYSIEQYFYERLYKQGYAAKTEADGIDYDRRNLYFGFLEYGKSAQDLFYSDSADKIADDIYVAVKGNPTLSGVYAASDVITLKAPDVVGFDYWKVTELSLFGKVLGERKLGAGSDYVISNSALIVPVTDDDAAEDTDVITFNTESDKFITLKSANNVILSTEYDYTAGNWYYSVNKFGGSMVRYQFLPTGGVPAEEATAAEISFDLYIPSDAAFYWQFNLVTNAAKDSGSTYLWAPFLYSARDKLVYGAWNSFRIVYTPNPDFVVDAVNNPYDEGAYTASYYVNDIFVKTDNKNYSKTRDGAKDANVPMFTDLYAFELAFPNDARGAYKFDNVSFVYK
jgi:hypothetical protein